MEYVKLNILDNATLSVCREVGIVKAIRILAYMITIIKILVPIILIVTGIISLFRAVLADDESALKRSVSLLFTKFLVGAFIFFIPTIMTAIMGYAHNYDKTKSKFTDCLKCLNSVKACNNLIGKN